MAANESSDTLLRHISKLHADEEVSGLDISSKTPIESPVISATREMGAGASNSADRFSSAVHETPMADEETCEVAHQTIDLELRNEEWSPSAPFRDQSAWWLDYNFDPNSLDMSLLDPVSLPDHFHREPAGQTIFDEVPSDRSLPGNDIQKLWFTYFDHSRILDASHENVGQRSRLMASTVDSYPLDEDFRTRVGRRLTPHLNVDPLPSTGLLVSPKLYPF